MGLGLSNIVVSQKRSAGGGGTVTGAENGLSVKAGKVVLGNDVGEAGDPGQLLSLREILTNNFSIGFIANAGAVNNILSGSYDVNGHIIGIALDNQNAGAGAKINIKLSNDSNQAVRVGVESSAAASANRRFIDSGGGMIDIGDCFGAGAGTKLRINESGSQLTASGQLLINGIVPGTVSLSVKGAATQSTYILDVLDSAGDRKFGVWPTGDAYMKVAIHVIGSDIAFGDILASAYGVIQASQAAGIKYRDNAGNVPFIFEFNNGSNAWADLNIIRTAAITGALGTREKWKLGSVVAGFAGDGSAAEVEIGGTKFYLLTGQAV